MTIQNDPPPRLPPLARENFDDDVQAYLSRWTVGPFKDPEAYPPVLTLAHHPKLADLFSVFNIHLLTTSTLPVKQRQMAIMRTCWVTKAVYPWSSHLRTSAMLGLGPDMYRPIQTGPDDPYFSPFERSIILATDELVEKKTLGDESWQALSVEWSSQQMLDFLFTVGCYAMVAGVMNAARVQREPELLELAEKYGAPDAPEDAG